MATVKVEGPDGRIYTVEVPDGASEEQVLSFVASQVDAQPGGTSVSSGEQRSTMDELGRQLGLTARHAIAGPAKFATGINDAFNMAIDATLDMAGSDYRVGLASPRVDSALDAIGLPKPETTAEEYAGVASEFLSGGATPLKAGERLAAYAPKAVSAVGETLASNPLNQAVSAVAGGLGLEAADQAGMSPLEQMGVSALASLTPSAAQVAGPALVRGGFRGRSPELLRENIGSFEGAGAEPSVGQAAQNRRTQAAESFLSRTPGGAGVMSSKATRQADEVGQFVESTVNQTARRANPERAGIEVERGIAGDGGFVNRFTAKAKELYDAVDQYINPEQPIALNNTKQVFETPSAMAESAPNVSRKLRSNFIEDLGLALDDDVEAYINANGFEGLPYAAVKQIRTEVGRRLNNLSLIDDATKGELKQLYGALSEDLTEAARMNGDGAFRAAKRADQYWKAGRERVDLIERVINKNGGPEKIFSALMSGTKDGATVLRTVMKSLRPEERKWVSATVIRRMGKATPGQQDAGGDKFSLSTYLTNWSKLSPEAKGVLLSGQDPDLISATNHVSKVASNVRDGSKVFSNPSGTAQAGNLQALLTGGGVSAFLGNVPLTAVFLGIPVSANLGARLMTNGRFVNWLARTTQMPQGATSAGLNELSQLAASSDDVAEFYSLINQE